MRTRIFKQIISSFLFFCLTFISFVKNSKGQWTAPQALSGLPADNRVVITDILNTFIFAPLLVIGLLFYGIYFYKKIRKKDREKRKKFFNAGTLIILIFILLYIVSIIITTLVII